MSVTLRNIAKRAHVATSTVSRVLNADTSVRISEQTKRRVRAVAEELAYKPNLFARGMRVGQLPLIAILVMCRDDTMTTRKALRLNSALLSLGRQVVLIDIADPTTYHEFVDTLLRTRPEAVAIVHAIAGHEQTFQVCEKLMSAGVHVAVVDCWPPLPEHVRADAVTIDREYGAYLAATHVIELGHRHIGLVGHEASYGRREGYERALSKYGIEERYLELMRGPDDVEMTAEFAREAARRLLSKHPQITALLCNCDLSAVAALRGLHDIGLQVPCDVSLVGWDDDPWCQYLPTALTTLTQPCDELAAAGARLLGDRLNAAGGPWRREVLRPRLQVRESTAPPRCSSIAVSVSPR